MRKVWLVLMFVMAVKGGRVQRQANTEIAIVCSACEQSKKRISEHPSRICCKCIKETAACNNNLPEKIRKPLLPIEDFPVRNGDSGTPLGPGLTCQESLDCEVFRDCGCKVANVNVRDVDNGIDLRQAGGDESNSCPVGQKLCCNPVSGEILEVRLGLVGEGNPLGEDVNVDTVAVCESQDLSAIQNFGLGLTCGKRDSRAYYDASLAESFTNPGEWPWVVLIFKDGSEYVGAGAMLDNDVVVTVGHKVLDFTRDASRLTVRMGDWNPNTRDNKEEHPAIERKVTCVRIHPKADLLNTLANNVAVLKLENELIKKAPFTNAPNPPEKEKERVFGVVDLRSAPQRDAEHPEGMEGSSFTDLDTRSGLVSQLTEFDPLGGRKTKVTPSYINTVCLPQDPQQFEGFRGPCWVAAWGNDLERQREVDLPLVSKAECERKLQPIFERKGVQNWRLKPSEICAGGIPGKDTCQGEGGAPLVCLDPESDQFFAVGLVNYGFECNTSIPAVYTNLADPVVKQFITSSFHNNGFCEK